MKGTISPMKISGKIEYISKYDVMVAFFKTEEDENEEMAQKLNEMLGLFYSKEQETKRNVTSLPFNIINENKKVINYIKEVSI